jgi:hypothetical protein
MALALTKKKRRPPPPLPPLPSFHRANHDASDDIDGENEGDYSFDR